MEAPQTTAPDLDFKALARQIRAHGIETGKESNRLLVDGEVERARHLSEASTGLAALAVELEAWRQHAAALLSRLAASSALRGYALGSIDQNVVQRGEPLSPRELELLEKVAGPGQDIPAELERIAQQLDPRQPEGEPGQ